ncbi:M56 family metallopeptidase [Niabella sp.]|uniref:M56 family metallopeptidase n=1 Tax=Niabella sp. TaxID=1962976 RepID=UPI00262C8169|nr:M56 family metallopeptidase [Niabella sp.]
MIIYLLKMIACCAAFYALYALLFQKEKMLVFNRIYLLAALVLSFWIPLITVQVKVPETVPALQTAIGAGPQQPFYEPSYLMTDDAPAQDGNYFHIWGVFYAVVSVLLLLRFARNIRKLQQSKVQHPAVYLQTVRLVLLPEAVAPYSFLNAIFLNKQEYEAGKIAAEVLEHERAHIRQKHSWDILFIELLQIMIWFNPVIYLYKRSVKINHELLADAAVVKGRDNVHHYQQVLLQRTMMQHPAALASHFTFYTTKKRLIMLNKTFSKKRSLLLGLTVIPLLAIVVFFIGERVYAQTAAQDNIVLSQVSDTVPSRLPPPPPPPFTWETQHKFSEWPVILEYFDGRHTISSQMKNVKLPKGAKNLVLKAGDQKITEVIVVHEGFKSVIENVSSGEKKEAFEKKYGIALPDNVPRPTTADKAHMLRGTGATRSKSANKAVYGPGATAAEMNEYISLMKKSERIRNGRKVYIAKDENEQARQRELLSKMDAKQLRSVSNFPPPPPPPPPPPASNKPSGPVTVVTGEHYMKIGDINRNREVPLTIPQPENTPDGIQPPVLIKERVAPRRSAGVANPAPVVSTGNSRVLETKRQ